LNGTSENNVNSHGERIGIEMIFQANTDGFPGLNRVFRAEWNPVRDLSGNIPHIFGIGDLIFKKGIMEKEPHATRFGA
jgi:hypothetical protein